MKKNKKPKKYKKLYALADLMGYFFKNLKKGESIIKISFRFFTVCVIMLVLCWVGKEDWLPAAVFTSVDWRDIWKIVFNKDSG